MVYLKAIQKITPMDVSVSGTIDEKTYLKKFRGGFSPLSSPPGSAYDCSVVTVMRKAPAWSTRNFLLLSPRLRA